MNMREWFMLRLLCLWFAVLLHSSVAVVNNYTEWIKQCNCSCLIPNNNDCTAKEAYTIDNQGNIYLYSNFSLFKLNTRPWRKRRFACEPHMKRGKMKYILINFSCLKGELAYVFYKLPPRQRLKIQPPNFIPVSKSKHTTISSKQDRGEKDSSEAPNKLVIGLSVSLGLMVAIVICWTWIRCRRRRKKNPEEKKQNVDFGYIDEEEDSVPYRIVDLKTNISCDAQGYTFLEAPNLDENPYMKLRPKSERFHNQKPTQDEDHNSLKDDQDEKGYETLKRATENENGYSDKPDRDSVEEDVDDEERPYQILQPTCDDVDNENEQKDDFEEIVDEPVYHMLEGKENSKTL